VSDDEFVATRDGFRLFARRSGRGARSLVLPGIGAEMDFAPLCAKTGLAMSDPVAFARSWRRIVAPTRMVNPTAFENLEVDPSIWPNEWPEHMTDALKRVAATHPVEFDYRAEARRISAPTLVIHGDRDNIPLLASEEWTRAIPSARLLVLPEVGHFPHAEAPATFFDAVQTFLDGDWPTHSVPLTA